MLLPKEHSMSIATVLFLLGYLRSMPSVESLECPHCGFSIGALRADGTALSTCEIVLNVPKSSPHKLFLVLTSGGKLSISCGCSQSDAHQSRPRSGDNVGISFTPVSSRSTECQPCGCDPGLKRPKQFPNFYVCGIWPECAYGRSQTHHPK